MFLLSKKFIWLLAAASLILSGNGGGFQSAQGIRYCVCDSELDPDSTSATNPAQPKAESGMPDAQTLMKTCVSQCQAQIKLKDDPFPIKTLQRGSLLQANPEGNGEKDNRNELTSSPSSQEPILSPETNPTPSITRLKRDSFLRIINVMEALAPVMDSLFAILVGVCRLLVISELYSDAHLEHLRKHPSAEAPDLEVDIPLIIFGIVWVIAEGIMARILFKAAVDGNEKALQNWLYCRLTMAVIAAILGCVAIFMLGVGDWVDCIREAGVFYRIYEICVVNEFRKQLF
ncbi:unnamed protein product [Orchesella dallaii]|uniref:Uncharacterized protein n=1 Tax=Orchesella dallaii TaxID=48710 RepID=A0ABP1RJN4_9HEXA